MEEIVLKVDYIGHETMVLTNNNGDMYTTHSEELMDFVSRIKKPSVYLKCGCGGNMIPTEDGLICDVCG